MTKYRKKPVAVEAWQWTGMWIQTEVPAWVKEYRRSSGVKDWIVRKGDVLIIPTPEGDMIASIGDWLIQGVKGEVYPCKPDIFEATYEESDD